MNKTEFEKTFCSKCKHRLEKVFDKCTPQHFKGPVSTGGKEFEYTRCQFYEEIKKEDIK